MTDLETAWVAGWLEGEGCFLYKPACNGNASPRISIEVFSVDLDVLQKASAMLNSPLYVIPARGKSQAGWRLNITGQTALDVMSAIRSYMGTRRGQQIDRALLAWENRPNKPVTKLCACGCGEEVFGDPRRLYARSAGINGSSACAQRAYRNRRAA